MAINRILREVGNTEIIKIKSLLSEKSIYLKLENQNPSGSIKDRLAKHILLENENENHFVDASIGNFAISMSWFATLSGKKTSFFVPEKIKSCLIEKIVEVGGELIFVNTDNLQAISNQASSYAEKNNAFFCSQFKTHQTGTYTKPLCDEIHNQLGQIKYIVTYYGSGGITNGMKNNLPKEWETKIFSPTIETNDKPRNTNKILVDLDFALEVQKHLLQKQGIRSGLIGAINTAAAMQLSQRNEVASVLTFISDSL